MASCPVCYERFTVDNGSLGSCVLTCGHVICYGCISNDFIDKTYFCPECGSELKGTSIDDFAERGTVILHTDQSIGSNINLEEVSYSADTEPLTMRPVSMRIRCKHPDCGNKAIASGSFCLLHSTHRLHDSFRGINKIAQEMAKTSLNLVSGNELQQFRRDVELDPADLRERFKLQQRIELGEAMALIDRAREIMFREPNIITLDAPLLTVGDIHGQFFDLVTILDEGGTPGQETYLFLGDYVDRGSFSCEVMFLLLSLKVRYPEKIWLLRGNHECGSVSGHFGFKEECKIKYGVNVYYKFLLLFQTMPLAAIISTAYGDIFACHGGISPSFSTLDEIGKIYRFVEPEADAALLDILWSDPVGEEEVEDMTDEEYESFLNIDWRPNPLRGCSHSYGYKALREFLDKNTLVCIVRAHEVQEDGFRKHFDPSIVQARIRRLINRRNGELVDVGDNTVGISDEADFPPLITIFSAPNYCDRYENKAAFLHIDIALERFCVIQYECVDHPVPEIHENQSENHLLAIISACPYMPTSFRNFVRFAVDLGIESEKNVLRDESPASSPLLLRARKTSVSSVLGPEESSSPRRRFPLRRSFTDHGCGMFHDAVGDRPLRISLTKQQSREDLDCSMDGRARGSSMATSNTPARGAKVRLGDDKGFFLKRYMEAVASDSINEVHPDKLSSFVQQVTGVNSFSSPVKQMKVIAPEVVREREKDLNLFKRANKEGGAGGGGGAIIEAFVDELSPTSRQSFRQEILRSAEVLQSQSFEAGNATNSYSHRFHVDDEGGVVLSPSASLNSDVNSSSAAIASPKPDVRFSSVEILALKLMFSLFDRSGSSFIAYEDLVAYAEETKDLAAIREAALALEIVDIDGDGKIGLLDFIHFAARLKASKEQPRVRAGSTAIL